MKIWQKTIVFVATFALLLNSLSAPLTVLAEESPTPTPEVTVSPTDSPTVTSTPTPTDEVTPTPSASPTDTPEITPTEEPTATPDATITPSANPTDTPSSQPSTTNGNQGSSSSSQATSNPSSTSNPTSTPIVIATPSATPEVQKDGTVTTQIVTTNIFPETVQNDLFELITDKLDYSPTEIAIITGSNFIPNKSYSLTVSSTDDPATSTTVEKTTDESGSFTYEYQLDGNYRPNYSVEVKDGEEVVATTSFTDSINIQGVSIGSQTPSPVVRGSSATFPITVNFTGSGSLCTATLSTTSLPGVISSFSPSSVTSSANQSTLTLTTSGSTPLDSTSFTVTATKGSSCGGTNKSADGTLNVTIHHTISAGSSSGGSIDPTGSVTVNDSTDQTFTITPSTGSIYTNLLVDGSPVGTVNSYTFNNVTTNHTISASFDGGWYAADSYTNGSGSNGFTNAGPNALSNDAYVSATTDGKYETLGTFNIPTIPSGNTINGIEVAVEGNTPGSRNVTIALSKNGGSSFGSTTNSTSFISYDSTNILGGATNLWGQSWSSSSFTNANFAVKLTSGTGSGQINIDQVQVKVFYSATPSKTDQTITFDPLSDKTYGSADFTVSATGGGSGNPVAFATTSTACSVTSGGLVHITSIGSCSITANQAGNSGYNAAAPVTQGFTINKANSNVTVSCPTVDQLYTGLAQTPCTASFSTSDGLNGPLTVSYLNNLHAGTATANANYAGDSNHTSSGNSATFTISPIDPICNITGYSVIYDGNSHGAMGSCTGAGSDGVLNGLNLGDSFTDVPGGTANWSFTDSTGNYNNASGSVIITISKAAPICSVAGYNVDYDGNSHTATGNCTGVKNETLSGLDLSGTTHTAVANYNADPWAFTDITGNYNNTSGSVDDFINDITPPTTTNNVDGLWHNSDVTVTLTCVDDIGGAGCANTYYTTDGSDPTTSPTVQTGNSFTLSADGIYTIKYYSVDKSGNTEAVKTAINQVKIDQTEPTASWVNPTDGQTVSGTVSLSVTTDDNLSGVASVIFKFKKSTDPDSSYQTISTDWDTTGLPLDNYSLQAIVTDHAGNQKTINETVGVAAVVSGEYFVTVSTNQVYVSWHTDRPTTSRIIYDTIQHGSPDFSDTYYYGYAHSTPTFNTDPKVYDHIVYVSDLPDGTNFFYRTVSSGSPTAIGPENYFRTFFMSGPGSSSNTSGGGAAVLGTNTTGSWSKLAYAGTGTTVVLGAETTNAEATGEASPAPEVASTQTVNTNPGFLKWILTHKKIDLGILLIILAILYGLRQVTKKKK